MYNINVDFGGFRMNNVLNFYMKANDLKNIMADERYSVADN